MQDNESNNQVLPPVATTVATPAAVVPEQKRATKFNKTRIIALIISVSVILVLVLVSVVLNMKQQSDYQAAQSKATAAATTIDQKAATITDSGKTQVGATAAAKCGNGLASYTNTELKISFCYPSTWGDVIAENARYDISDQGSRWLIRFSAKPQIHAGVVSKDWSTKEARDATCSDLITSNTPDFSKYNTAWSNTDPETESAVRGLAKQDNTYLVRETADSFRDGVCVEGYHILAGGTYAQISAALSAPFTDAIATPGAYIANPQALISDLDRTNFIEFVKSMNKI